MSEPKSGPTSRNRQSRVLKRLQETLRSGDYYGGLQLLLTLFDRQKAVKKYNEALKLGTSGAIQMLGYEQLNGALDLGVKCVDLLLELKRPYNAENARGVQTIIDKFPAGQQKSALLKKAIYWSKKHGGFKYGDPQLHRISAASFVEMKEFDKAVQHFLVANSPREFAECLFAWSGTDDACVLDVFVLLPVLKLLSIKYLEDASSVYSLFMQMHQDKAGKPLETTVTIFVQLLLQALERESLPLFQQLRERFAPELEQDEQYIPLMDAIANKFFGIPVPRRGLSGMLATAMDIFGGDRSLEEARPAPVAEDPSMELLMDDDLE